MNIPQIIIEDDDFYYQITKGKIWRKMKTYTYPTGEKRDRIPHIRLIDTDHGTGYKTIIIYGKSCKQHRILYEKAYGIKLKVDEQIDHINGIKSDNRIDNLTVVTPSQNCQNKGKSIINTSGHKNIAWHKRDEKWQVRIMENGRSKNFGYFDNIEDAIVARDNAIAQLNLIPGNIYRA